MLAADLDKALRTACAGNVSGAVPNITIKDIQIDEKMPSSTRTRLYFGSSN
jgi:hypothetical protein